MPGDAARLRRPEIQAAEHLPTREKLKDLGKVDGFVLESTRVAIFSRGVECFSRQRDFVRLAGAGRAGRRGVHLFDQFVPDAVLQ